MQVFRERLIHLMRCRGSTRRNILKMMQIDPLLEKIYELSPDILRQYGIKNAFNLYEDLHDHLLIQTIKQDLIDYHVITIVDEAYPPMLKPIKDCPLVIYAIGNIHLLQHMPALSVIGTRKPSKEAMGKVFQIIQPLIKEDWLIVSGMARGIDSYAHRITLNGNGKTIAVLGSGFDHIYPKENMYLFQEIAENGLVITEYPPSMRPSRYHFPERNRIISGLSFGTLVIEAMERSGTLITVDQALDQGREVYAVPGSPLIPQTKGCHLMIQDGAKLVQDATDLLEDWETIENNLSQSGNFD